MSKKQGKKSKLQDELVKFCIEKEGPGKNIYVFNNDDVKKLSGPIKFRNHNDATHIDTSVGLSPLMQKKTFQLFILVVKVVEEMLQSMLSSEAQNNAFTNLKKFMMMMLLK